MKFFLNAHELSIQEVLISKKFIPIAAYDSFLFLSKWRADSLEIWEQSDKGLRIDNTFVRKYGLTIDNTFVSVSIYYL